MESSTLYNISKDLTTKIKRMRPSASGEKDFAAAFIVNEKNKIFTGVTSLTFKNGDVENIPAEVVAFLSMKDTGSVTAKNLIIVSLADASIVMPSKQGLDMLTKADDANGACKVVVKEGKDLTIDDIIAGKTADDEPSEQKKEEPAAVSEPVSSNASAKEPEKTEEVQPDIEDAAAEDAVAAEPEAEALETPAAQTEEDTDFMFDMSAFEDEQITNKVEERSVANTGNVIKSEEEVENTANSISGVDIEESNPFFEAPEEVLPPVETIAAEEADEEDEPEEDKPSLSKEELLKQAKKRKKVAKANFKFKKKM
ncbi:MAG: hypothetical protein IJ696_00500 [Ruminococcus sp.]|nr:hypothetical protein [Ruminococcus sp.]